MENSHKLVKNGEPINVADTTEASYSVRDSTVLLLSLSQRIYQARHHLYW
jgi:hypothetical protein